MVTTALLDWVVGDMTGREIPAHAGALREGGAAYLTQALRATGDLEPDNAVVEITHFKEWLGGGTGSKAQLTVRYATPADLPEELFVKFSRNFDDPILDNTRYHMRPEVRLATLSRAAGFPIAVPQCVIADFQEETGTGILITARIPYGRDPIERHYPKCLDREMPDPLGHYRALIKAIASLAGTHKSGALPASVTDQFPFDRAAAEAANPCPPPERLAAKIARLVAFSRDFPQLLPAEIASPAFLDRFAQGAAQFQGHERAIKHFLHDNRDFIALCHWNANVDNAWFWREADGELACGLMDWGSVGQMSIAMTLWGCLSGAEIWLWEGHLDEMLALFASTFEACGGPAIDVPLLKAHLVLYVAMMGIAWLLDAPARILRELPDLPAAATPDHEAILGNETARVQLAMMSNFLHLWYRADATQIIADRFATR
jgi:hypothetical protein